MVTVEILKTYKYNMNYQPLNGKNKKRLIQSSISLRWSWWRDLNTWPSHYEWDALPTELHQRTRVKLLYLKTKKFASTYV